MRRSALICALLWFSGIASAQDRAAIPKLPIPESGFVSPHQYTNAFFGFSLPLPSDRHFHVEDMSESDKVAQHFLFGQKAIEKGLSLMIVSATQVLNPRNDDAQRAAFLPGKGGKGPQALNIGGRLFWKSDVQEKTFSGKLRRLRYTTSLAGFVLQFSVSTYNSRRAEELQDKIESLKFFDPARAQEFAGVDARPFLPRAARLRMAGAPVLDASGVDPGRVSGNAYINSYFGFIYRFPEGLHLRAADAEMPNAGLAALGQGSGIAGAPAKCTRLLLRVTRDAEGNQAQSFAPSITLVAADPGCFARDAKFPTSLNDRQAMQSFGQALVRAFSGTQLTRQDSVTLRGVKLDGHIFLEMPNDTTLPVSGSSLLRKIHSSLVLTSIKDYWVIWIFQSESESELASIMKAAISFEHPDPRLP